MTLAGLALVFEGALLALALALGALLGVAPFSTARFDARDLAWGVAATGPLVLALWWSLHKPWRPVERLTQAVLDQLGPLLASSSLGGLAVVAVLAGIAEEAFFRGVVQAALHDVIGTTPAILAAAALFGIAHLVTPLYAILAAAIGVYLGVLFAITGNVVAPALTHALYDFIALVWVAGIARQRAGDEDAGPALDASLGAP